MKYFAHTYGGGNGISTDVRIAAQGLLGASSRMCKRENLFNGRIQVSSQTLPVTTQEYRKLTP
jgi:hypothetical protein